MESKYKFLKKWEYPQNYCGEDYSDYYSMGIGQSRDSECLERSNFTCALEALGGETETVIVARAGHWAVGWVESLLIHESDLSALAKAEKLAERLDGYPVVDEHHFSELEHEERHEWAEQVKADTAQAICNHFGLGDEIAESESMIELAYYLQLYWQEYAGNDSSLNCNQYHPIDDRDLENVEQAVKMCLENRYPENSPALDLLCACFDINQKGA